MILFDLRCADGHEFEAWFRDSTTYEAQAAAGEIGCPVCGDHRVEKALMAPALASKASRVDPEQAAQALKAWRKVQQHIEQNFDHVGQRFAEEARKIHHGEAEKRSIYGEATRTEAKELKDEGIPVGQIPWLPRHDS
jgi:hypothetical protein